MKFTLALIALMTTTSLLASTGKKELTDKEVADIAFAEEMTKEAMDFHALMDKQLERSPMKTTAGKLFEKAGDKDLAKVVVIVNRAPKGSASDAQTARFYVDGKLEATYPVSTGKIGYETRIGYFRPVYTNHLRFYYEYYSGKYGSLMARAIFFSGGYAIHHTGAIKYLGQRASHGCVRFHIDNIDKINTTAKDLLGNQNYVLRQWTHNGFPSWKKNIYYKGLERSDVNPINRYTGEIDYSKTIKSLDMVILVKDQRDSDA